MRFCAGAFLLAALALAGAGPGHAHRGNAAASAGTDDATAATAQTPLPYAGPGRFALVDHTGVRRTEADFPGRFRLVYFGYTACPYTCGLALANISGALDALGADAARVAALFVSVDPVYDTPARMAAHLANFDPRIIGLTGAPDEVARLAAAFGVEARAVEDPGAFERLVDHTPFTWLVAPDGTALTLFPPIVPGAQMAETIRRYLGAPP